MRGRHRLTWSETGQNPIFEGKRDKKGGSSASKGGERTRLRHCSSGTPELSGFPKGSFLLLRVGYGGTLGAPRASQPRTRVHSGLGGAVRIGSQAKPCKIRPPAPGGIPGGVPGRGLQTTSYSLRAGNSASFYQTPHQSFYISPPSAGSTQTLHPLPGSRTPCASCSAPVTLWGGWRLGVSGRDRGMRFGGKSNRRQTEQKKKEHIMKVFWPRGGYLHRIA